MRSADRFTVALDAAVARGLAAMDVVHRLVAGKLTRADAALLAARWYAEIRTFVDLKLPERLRLCPYGAMRAREFFARAYVEEHGRFAAGADHPALFARLCTALDVPAAVLNDETRRYARRFHAMREEEPSAEAMVRELAIAYAWESAAPVWGDALAGTFERHYGVPASALEFFTLHREVDRAHAAEALAVLRTYADTDALRELAVATVVETLDLTRYFDHV